MTSYMKFSYVQNQSYQKEKGDSQKDMAAMVEESVQCVLDGADSTIFA